MKRFEYIITEKKEPLSLGGVSIIRNVNPGIKGVYSEYHVLFEYLQMIPIIQIDYRKRIKYYSDSIVDLCKNMGITLDEFVSKFKNGFEGYFSPTSAGAVIEFSRHKFDNDFREFNRKLHHAIMKNDKLIQLDGFLSSTKESGNESSIGPHLIDIQFNHNDLIQLMDIQFDHNDLIQLRDIQFDHNDLIEFGIHMAFHERKWIAENVTDSEYIPHEEEIQDLRATVIEELKSFIKTKKL